MSAELPHFYPHNTVDDRLFRSPQVALKGHITRDFLYFDDLRLQVRQWYNMLSCNSAAKGPFGHDEVMTSNGTRSVLRSKPIIDYVYSRSATELSSKLVVSKNGFSRPTRPPVLLHLQERIYPISVQCGSHAMQPCPTSQCPRICPTPTPTPRKRRIRVAYFRERFCAN